MTGTRENEGKPRISLVLEAKHAVAGASKVLEFGAVKYGRGNWQKGLELTEIVDSIARHLIEFLDGNNLDKESNLPHVDHILTNAIFLAEHYRGNKNLDKRVP